MDISKYIATDIRKTYRNLVKGLITEGKTLKTDTWNETMTDYPIEADKYIELDEERVREARKRGYDVVSGDIRKLPFRDNSFDNVVDLSTIDHMIDYEVALKEYSRVLVAGGKLLIIVWLDKDRERRLEEWGGYQYWFPEEEFVRKLPFKIIDEYAPLVADIDSYLKLFYCENELDIS